MFHMATQVPDSARGCRVSVGHISPNLQTQLGGSQTSGPPNIAPIWSPMQPKTAGICWNMLE
jgi:hypothetical protein